MKKNDLLSETMIIIDFLHIQIFSFKICIFFISTFSSDKKSKGLLEEVVCEKQNAAVISVHIVHSGCPRFLVYIIHESKPLNMICPSQLDLYRVQCTVPLTYSGALKIQTHVFVTVYSSFYLYCALQQGIEGKGPFKYYVIMFLTFLGSPTHLFDDSKYFKSSKNAIISPHPPTSLMT